MALFTCITCQAIKGAEEFNYKNRLKGERKRTCRSCENQRKRELRHQKKAGNAILIVSCTHYPFNHPDYIDWLMAVWKRFKCNEFVHLGDLYDVAGVNRFFRDPTMPNINEEFDRARGDCQRLFSVFPKAKYIVGNHCARVTRAYIEAGLPELLLPNPKNAFGLPDSWEVYKGMIEMGDTVFVHGNDKPSDALSYARMIGRNIVMGDKHTKLNVQHMNNDFTSPWSMQVGCGISRERKAFDYTKKHIAKPIVGCGLLIEGNPIVLAMPMDKYGRWTGSLKGGSQV